MIEKIPDTSGLVTASLLNTKISAVENKTSNTSNLVGTIVLNTELGEGENKLPDNAKYITTQEFNKLIAQKFPVILKQTDLMNKTDFHNKLTSFSN